MPALNVGGNLSRMTVPRLCAGDIVVTPLGRRASVLDIVAGRAELAYLEGGEDTGERVSLDPAHLQLSVRGNSA